MLNSHLEIAQKLVQHPLGPGCNLVKIENIAGCSPSGEAELAGWKEGAKRFVQEMNLNDEEEIEGQEGKGDVTLDTEIGTDRDIEVNSGCRWSNSEDDNIWRNKRIKLMPKTFESVKYSIEFMPLVDCPRSGPGPVRVRTRTPVSEKLRAGYN